MKKGENMNREIKFRAWDKVKKEMCFDVTPDPSKFSHCWVDRGIGGEHADGDEERYSELMQYTGSKDKTGREVYEGDILRQWDDLFVITEMEHGSFGITVYKELRNGGTVEDCHYVISALVPDSCEIIGNIYENPELLEPKP